METFQDRTRKSLFGPPRLTYIKFKPRRRTKSQKRRFDYLASLLSTRLADEEAVKKLVGRYYTGQTTDVQEQMFKDLAQARASFQKPKRIRKKKPIIHLPGTTNLPKRQKGPYKKTELFEI